jgi:predicted nucleotidyltransferase
MTLEDADIQKLAKTDINAVVLFGSQAQGSANEASDYDIFVIGKKTRENYDLVYDVLSNKINKITDLDIVFEESAPGELKNHVVKYGQVLFQKDDLVFPNFKQRAIIEYSDFAPVRAIYSNATLARINS